MNVMFNPEIIYDESKNSYTVSIKQLGAIGYGNNLETAIDILIDKIEILTFTYFDNLISNLELNNYAPYYDYYIEISRCTTKKELLEMIGLKN